MRKIAKKLRPRSARVLVVHVISHGVDSLEEMIDYFGAFFDVQPILTDESPIRSKVNLSKWNAFAYISIRQSRDVVEMTEKLVESFFENQRLRSQRYDATILDLTNLDIYLAQALEEAIKRALRRRGVLVKVLFNTPSGKIQFQIGRGNWRVEQLNSPSECEYEEEIGNGLKRSLPSDLTLTRREFKRVDDARHSPFGSTYSFDSTFSDQSTSDPDASDDYYYDDYDDDYDDDDDYVSADEAIVPSPDEPANVADANDGSDASANEITAPSAEEPANGADANDGSDASANEIIPAPAEEPANGANTNDGSDASANEIIPAPAEEPANVADAGDNPDANKNAIDTTVVNARVAASQQIATPYVAQTSSSTPPWFNQVLQALELSNGDYDAIIAERRELAVNLWDYRDVLSAIKGHNKGCPELTLAPLCEMHNRRRPRFFTATRESGDKRITLHEGYDSRYICLSRSGVSQPAARYVAPNPSFNSFQYLSGNWFEEFAYSQLYSFLETKKLRSLCYNVLTTGAQLDVVAKDCTDRIYLIECKAGKLKNIDPFVVGRLDEMAATFKAHNVDCIGLFLLAHPVHTCEAFYTRLQKSKNIACSSGANLPSLLKNHFIELQPGEIFY